jgi:signal peptidase II
MLLLTISPLIIIVDQVSKYFVRSNLALGESWAPWQSIMPFARIVHWYNTGVAFGFFQDQNLVFASFSALIAFGIIWFFPKITQDEKILRFALAMQLGGAMGNLIDRLTIGHVIDFVSIGNFAVFNVADGSISIGVAIMVLAIILQDIQDKKNRLIE